MLAVTAIALIAMIALAIPIAAALGLLGVGLGIAFSPVALDRALGEIFWRSSNDFRYILYVNPLNFFAPSPCSTCFASPFLIM